MNDAKFWKNELFRESARMRERIDKDGAERLAQHSVMVERFAFLTAYMMRKLKEAIALSREVTRSKWDVREFEQAAPPPPLTWFRISEDGETWRRRSTRTTTSTRLATVSSGLATSATS
jgi:hypothetical protein